MMCICYIAIAYRLVFLSLLVWYSYGRTYSVLAQAVGLTVGLRTRRFDTVHAGTFCIASDADADGCVQIADVAITLNSSY